MAHKPHKPTIEDAFQRLLPETPLECTIISSAEWIEGIKYGKPRQGHPEGEVIHHIHEVLDNIERLHAKSPFREKLRLIALIHDAFKYKVNHDLPKIGENYHATIARRFAEKWISDQDVLDVIQYHDDAYDAWIQGSKYGNWDAAEQQANDLIEILGSNLKLYLDFFECDTATGDKVLTPLKWFNDFINK
jgi:hypothetical protein